jgi:tetratricopeptide (TPR) repeat protein
MITGSAVGGETNGRTNLDDLLRGGFIHFSQGDLDKAIADYSAVIQIDSTNAVAIFNRAESYRAKREFKNSLADWNKYIRLHPTNALALKNRAAVFDAIGEFDRAINDCDEGLRLNPNDADALTMRGDCHGHKGQFNESLEDFYQAIRIDPACESAWNNLGWLRATCPVVSIRAGKEAVEAATKACELSHWMNWGRIDTLAAAFAEAGDFDQAVKYQKRALAMNGISDKDRQDMFGRLLLFEQRAPYRDSYKP